MCWMTTGPGPQPLRGMPGFPSQQQPQARNASMATSRLPNGKLGALYRSLLQLNRASLISEIWHIGSNANWSFGLPMGAAPGLQNHQQRNIGSMGTFAQSLGGSQPATPLDLSYVFLDTFGLRDSGQNRWLIFAVLVNFLRYQVYPNQTRLSPLLKQCGRMLDSGRPSKHRFKDNSPPRASLRREPPKPRHTSPSNSLPKTTYFHLALNSQTD
jgi:hypothetical protein